MPNFNHNYIMHDLRQYSDVSTANSLSLSNSYSYTSSRMNKVINCSAFPTAHTPLSQQTMYSPTHTQYKPDNDDDE